jgi:fructose-bisphosphate aldolase class I
MRNYVSGVILYDETLRQKAKNGTPLVDLIKRRARCLGSRSTPAPSRCRSHPARRSPKASMACANGCRSTMGSARGFAKWRAVISIGDGRPSWNCVNANAHTLARYAALCQETGIVPIVEPEILMDGPDAVHDIDQCYEVTVWTLQTVFQELSFAKVRLEGMVLKPNMVVPGQTATKRASVEEVAEKTVKALKATVPPAVPGIAFLSGGQSDEEATAHLSAMNAMYDLPWKLTFSYGRALQAAALKAWGGKAENVRAGQTAFAHRAKMNGIGGDRRLERATREAGA